MIYNIIIYKYICMYIVVTTKEFSENKVLNIVSQLKLHLLPHVVALCFTYDDNLQTGAEDGWVLFL